MIHAIDLHADLLCYLAAQPNRTPLQSTSRCALHQLRAGGVDVQILPIFTLGHTGSSELGLAQAACFAELTHRWAPDYRWLAPGDTLAPDPSLAPGQGPIRIAAAIENASSFCEAEEPLEDGLARFDALEELTGPILYVSLTWRSANRFGGGDAAPRGISADGRRLLDALAERVPCVDLSHASDLLARGILGHIDSEGLPLTPIASHSNFRAVHEHARNLPDELALEIVRRGGVIGLNLVRDYVGVRIEQLAEHVRYGLEQGWGDQLALGTDFFWEGDLPSAGKFGKHRFFFEGFEDASCHPAVQAIVAQAAEGREGLVAALAGGNARRFLQRVWDNPG